MIVIFMVLSFLLKKKLFVSAKYANVRKAKLIAFNAMGGAILISLVFYVSVVVFGERIHWLQNTELIYSLILWSYYVWFCWLGNTP